MPFMTRYLITFLLPATIALTSCSKSANPGISTSSPSNFRTESSAYVREDKDSWTYVTDNSSFHFDEVLGDQGSYEAVLLLEETYHNENTPGIEGMRGEATVKAWTMGAAHQRELRWTAHEKANTGEIQERFFRLTAWGCCDAPNVYTYYSLLSGKKLYVSNSDLLEIRGKGEGPLAFRYVGFGFDMNNLSHDPVLEYGTDKDIAQRFSIHSGKSYYEAPEVLGAANGKFEKYHLDLSSSPLTFEIVLRYPGQTELRIPVENDAIHLEKATLPKGYSIRQEN
jgi:hypothetical protein